MAPYKTRIKPEKFNRNPLSWLAYLKGRAGLIVCLYLLMPCTLTARMLFDGVFNISADSIANVLLVDKSTQRLYIVNSNQKDSVRLVAEFFASTGKVAGDKVLEGDMKTPEGIYLINGKISGETLPDRYGPLALVLDYPNYIDRLYEHTGSNIWIHGRNEKIVARQTNGCISLNNSHILDLLPFIEINTTRVIIRDSLPPLSADKYQTLQAGWKAILDNWAGAWEQGRLTDYFDYYAPWFQTHTHRNLAEFKQYKKRIEQRYDWKKIELDNIRVYAGEHEALIEFDQQYFCPYFYSRGTKQIYCINSNPDWRIVREDFTRRRPQRSITQLINRFIKEWEQAWESRNISRYMAFYDSGFRTGNMDYTAWQQDKTARFRQAENINLQIRDINFTETDTMRWQVSFKQQYGSDVYRDFGIKTLTVTGYPGHFRITRETWQPLD